MNKVYVVISVEEGSYIGHGLYNECTQILSVHASKESAEKEAKRLKQEDVNCFVDMMDIKD